MAGEDIIMATPEEPRRLHVIQKVLEGGLKQVEATEILSLSCRHIRRVVKRVKQEGERGIVHRLRGRPSNRRMPDPVKDRVINLYRTTYKGFGPTLASEKLLERDGVSISDETLRGWLLETGDWKRVRKGKKHREWRERKGHRGEMVQMDGSHHRWFEDRGDPCVLMGYIDDATGDTFGGFYDHEGTMPAMDSFRRYIRKRGLPLKVYLDKHSTYKSTAKATIEEQLAGVEPLSEFERALKELGVEVSHAHSPQAKGRIERLFRTFQDRLIKEMRLRGIKTIEEGNQFLEQYLPLYNKRFSVQPREKDDVHRPLPRGIDLNAILCIKTERTLRNDFTVAHNHKLYQIEEPTKASKVIVQDRMDSSMRITYQGRALRFREITERPLKENKPIVMRRTKTYIPPVDHPWRRFKIKNHHYYDRKRSLHSQI
ncbi:MAG TPA: ISNCY family transposase [Thermodesulfobacteriota bacterium]|nr:ISNCY family transposase [Thermodesulfobacteriota bacterium]